MHLLAMKQMVKIAKEGKAHLSEIVKKSTVTNSYFPDGWVDPEKLIANLKAAGYTIKKKARENGCNVEIIQRLDKLKGHRVVKDMVACNDRDPKAKALPGDTPVIVGRAYSFDEQDAVLQAVFAEMRESV